MPPDSPQAGHILANHAYLLGLTIDGYDSAQVAFDQALSIARRHQDAALEMRVLANSANIDGFHLRWDGSLAKSLQALEFSPRIDDPHTKMRARFWALNPLLYAEGDLESARSHLLEMLAIAERLRDAVWLPRAFFCQIELCCVVGDWQGARDLSDVTLGRFPHNPNLLGQRTLIEYETGDFVQGQVWLDRLLEAWELIEHSDGYLVDTTRYIVSGIPQISRITGVADRFDFVQTVARNTISSPYFISGYILLARCGLGLVASHLIDGALAAEQYPALLEHGSTLAPFGNLAGS